MKNINSERSRCLQPERISKVIARAGIASRREVERMIMQGRVKMNGVCLDTPAVKAASADRIEIDGKPLPGIERTRLWLYYKPAGFVTTNFDPEGRPTVFEKLPNNLPRVMSVGRLDINTEVLLLLTNDGGFSRILELPSTGWLRCYRVRAYGSIDQAKLDELEKGIVIENVVYGGIHATLDTTKGSNVWLTVGLREGKNRELKKVFEFLGLKVNRLIRISYGPFQLGEMLEGDIKEIRGRVLRDQLSPRLLEKAKVNFDAPVSHSATAIQNSNERNESTVRVTVNRRNEREKSDWINKPGERDHPPLWMQRKSRSSNVWMAPNVRSNFAKKVLVLGSTVKKKSHKNKRLEKSEGDSQLMNPLKGADWRNVHNREICKKVYEYGRGHNGCYEDKLVKPGRHGKTEKKAHQQGGSIVGLAGV